MYDVWRSMRRAHRTDTQGSDAKLVMLLLALVAMAGSAIYWWGVQSQLTDNKLVALGYTAILTLAPPFLTSFLIPWSPGGMLIQRLHSKTWGFAVVAGCALYLLYYSFQLLLSWWLAQPVVADSHLVYQQVLVGMIGFIIIPALLWTPVSDSEITEKVRQAHLVKQYTMQTRADIAILQANLLRAQIAAGVGYATLTSGERADIADNFRGVLDGVDRTLQLMAGNLNHAATNVFGDAATGAFSAPEFAKDLRDLIAYTAESLAAAQANVVEVGPVAPAQTSSSGLETIQQQLEARSRGDHLDAPTRPPQHSAAPRRETLRFAAEYESALQQLGGTTWSAAKLGQVLGRHPRTAFDRIQAWEAAGLVAREQDAKSSFYFTEVEG